MKSTNEDKNCRNVFKTDLEQGIRTKWVITIHLGHPRCTYSCVWLDTATGDWPRILGTGIRVADEIPWIGLAGFQQEREEHQNLVLIIWRIHSFKRLLHSSTRRLTGADRQMNYGILWYVVVRIPCRWIRTWRIWEAWDTEAENDESTIRWGQWSSSFSAGIASQSLYNVLGSASYGRGYREDFAILW